MELETWKLRLGEAATTEDLAGLLKRFTEGSEGQTESAVRETAFFLLDRLKEQQRADVEIDVMKSLLFEHVFVDLKTLLLLTDRWIQCALRIEDFEEMDEAVAYRERFLEPFPKEATMQAFYKAVSLEGKKQYRLALEALDMVPDNLSSAKLASKYLKKAMLSCRLREKSAAEESFQRALMFDPQRQNEMIPLIEADLAAMDGRYEDALESFQTFFVKTTQKLRYLDRYVDWSTAIGRYDDVAKFIREYLPKMATSLSKNYRIQFFESVIRFSDLSGNQEYLLLATQALRQLNSAKSKGSDCFVELERWMRHIDPNTDLHEAFRSLFSILSRHHSFERLHAVLQNERGAKLWRFGKDRLYESTVDSPWLIPMLNRDEEESIVFAEQIGAEIDYASNQPFSSGTAEAFLIHRYRDPSGWFAAWIVGVGEQEATQSVHRAVSLAFSIARFMTVLSSDYVVFSRQMKNFERYFEKQSIAFTSLKNGFLTLKNPAARQLFDHPSDMIAFELAFQRVRSEKPIYPDDFLRQKTFFVDVQTDESTWRAFRIDAFYEDDALSIAWTPLELSKQSSDRFDGQRQRTASLLDLSAEGFLIRLDFVSGDPFAGTDHRAKESIAHLLESSVKTSAGSYLADLRFDADGSGWAVLQTVDKRIATRIAKQTNDILRDRLMQEHSIGWDGILRFVCVLTKPERRLEDWKDAMERCAMDAEDGEPVAFVDRKTWERLERSNAMRVRLEEAMKSDRIPLLYQPFAHLRRKDYAFFLVSSHDPLDPDADLYAWTQTRFGMVQESTQTLWKKAMREIESFYRETQRDVTFAFLIDPTFLTVPASGRLMMLEAKRRKVPLSKLTVFVDLCGKPLNASLLTELSYLQAKGFSIGIRYDETLDWKSWSALDPSWIPYFKNGTSIPPIPSQNDIVGDRSDLPTVTIAPASERALSHAELIRKWPSGKSIA